MRISALLSVLFIAMLALGSQAGASEVKGQSAERKRAPGPIWDTPATVSFSYWPGFGGTKTMRCPLEDLGYGECRKGIEALSEDQIFEVLHQIWTLAAANSAQPKTVTEHYKHYLASLNVLHQYFSESVHAARTGAILGAKLAFAMDPEIGRSELENISLKDLKDKMRGDWNWNLVSYGSELAAQVQKSPFPVVLPNPAESKEFGHWAKAYRSAESLKLENVSTQLEHALVSSRSAIYNRLQGEQGHPGVSNLAQVVRSDATKAVLLELVFDGGRKWKPLYALASEQLDLQMKEAPASPFFVASFNIYGRLTYPQKVLDKQHSIFVLDRIQFDLQKRVKYLQMHPHKAVDADELAWVEAQPVMYRQIPRAQ